MRTLLISLLAIVVTTTNVNSHSWYDSDCCNDIDCAVAEVEMKSNGIWIITTKHGTVTVDPKNHTIRPSQDENFHACIYRNTNTNSLNLRCIYAPGGV